MSNYRKSRPFASNDSKYGEYSAKNLANKYEKSKELLVPDVKDDNEDALKIQKEEALNEVEPKTDQIQEIICEDPNVLGAKLLKAELMGDEELVKSLKARLESAQKVADVTRKEQKAQEIQDLNDQLNPYKKSSHKHKKHKKHHKSHNRERTDEEREIMSRNYKGPGGSDDDEGHVKKKQKSNDDNLKAETLKSKLNFFLGRKYQYKIIMQLYLIIKEQEASQQTVENCQYCFENAKRHLIVSIGKYSYLALPITQSITEGNCLIVPMHHCSSSVTCDEEVWEEIQQFRKALVKMFEPKRIDCVFFEQYSQSKKYSHMVIECVPLDMSVSNMAPIYFKKAIIESESEWATNKSIINLKDKSLRSTIPRNMPYFTVDFGLDNGYAHVIENDESFPDYFAKEIIGGILDLDPLSWRRPKNDDFSTQSKKTLEFLKWWKPYDFNSK